MTRILFVGLAITVFGDFGVAQQTIKDAELRIWTDTRGFEITARLSRYKDGIVSLRTNLRKNVFIPPNQLSKKDQDYIVKILKDLKRDKDAEEFIRLTETASQPKGSTNPGRYGSGSAMAPSSSTGVPPSSGGANPSNGSPGSSRGGAMPSSGSEYSGGGSPAGRGPGKSPAGDAPVAFGGQSNGRAPSPYTRTPDAEQADLAANPSGPRRKPAFAPRSGNNRIPTSGSSSPGNGRTVSSNGSASVPNANIDPFADIPKAPANVATESGRTEATTVEQTPPNDQNYQPPALEMPSTTAPPAKTDAARSSESAGNGWGTGTSLILIGVGIVGLLFLVMIGLLIMVLVKTNHSPARSTHY